MRRASPALLAITSVLALASCGDDGADRSVAAEPAPTSSPAGSTPARDPAASAPDGSAPAGTAVADELAVVAGEPFPEARCEANEAAGTITYLSGFDFAATASILDVVIAEEQGYFDELCLDVELQPSFSVDNFPIVASGDAHFASAGSFSEVVEYATANEADLVAVSVEGRTAIDALILKPGVAVELEDVEGATIGVKGAIPPSVAAMLAGVGLMEGEDYETVLLDGFDPLVHIGLDGIDGFPGYRSNEPGQLERAGVDFDLFVPADHDIPGSFGVLIADRAFLADHPTAAEDFLRATMRGLQAALADPEGAPAVALELIEANGNPSFLSPEGEAFRWQTDVEILTTTTPEGTGFGIPDATLLQAELDAYADVGLFDGVAPEAAGWIEAAPIESVYDGADVVWPG